MMELIAKTSGNTNHTMTGLDFACGVGTHCLTFNDFEIEGYGVDISETAINIAKMRAKQIGVSEDRFQVIDEKAKSSHLTTTLSIL